MTTHNKQTMRNNTHFREEDIQKYYTFSNNANRGSSMDDTKHSEAASKGWKDSYERCHGHKFDFEDDKEPRHKRWQSKSHRSNNYK